MIHLEKLGFLLLIAIGAIIYVAARKLLKEEDSSLAAAHAWIESHIVHVVVLLMLCIATIGVWAALDMNFAERPIVRHLNTPIFVKVPLGLLCGALIVELSAAIRKADLSPLHLAVRAVPFVFLFTIGFFSYELQRTLQFLTRIEAAGIALDFNTGSSQEVQPLIPSDSNLAGPGDIRTAFQLGVSLLPEAFVRVSDDSKRITEWCNKHESLNCGDKEALKQQHRTVNGYLERLYVDTTSYLKLLEPLKDCLSGVYVEYFPNGSPIQDELSEFAAAVSIDYAEDEQQDSTGNSDSNQRPLKAVTFTIDEQSKSVGTINLFLKEQVAAADPQHQDPTNRKGLGTNLQDLRKKLSRFGRYAWQYNFPDEGKGQESDREKSIIKCINIDKDAAWKNDDSSLSEGSLTADALIDKLRQFKKTNEDAYYEDLRRRTEQSNGTPVNITSSKTPHSEFSLPYVSIFEAAIIASSGYPEEAAGHLVREFGQLTNSTYQKRFGIEKGDFAEFLLEIRLLSPLEQIFAYSRNRSKQVHYAEALVDRVEVQLKKVRVFKEGQRSDFILYCANNRLFPEQKSGELSAQQNKDVEVYFRNLVNFYLRSYARLLEAVASDPGVFTRPDRFNKFVLIAEDLGELAATKPNALGGCIREALRATLAKQSDGPVGKAPIDQSLELLRYDLLAAYGFILARQADQREIDPEIAPNIDRSFKKDATCKAQRILLEAWRLRRVAEPNEGESADSAYTTKALRIRQILEQINRFGVDCVT